MSSNLPPEIYSALTALSGKECWSVAPGNGTGASFSAAFGSMRKRPTPLSNPHLSPLYRDHEAEIILMVWCTWRLDGKDAAITSSDDDLDCRERGLDFLLSKRVESFAVSSPVWDLTIGFSEGLALRIFCDHLSVNPSFDGNWHVEVRDQVVWVGPGATWGIERRTAWSE